MEQYVASIKKFFHNIWPVKIYHEESPAELETPSLAYNMPDQTDNPHTKLSYETFYILRVSVFEASDLLAYNKALQLSESIRKAKYRVPLINANGSPTGSWVHIESCAVSYIRDYEAQITISFAIHENFDKQFTD